MKRVIALIIFVLLIGAAAACSSQTGQTNETPQMLNVELSVKPDKIKPNQPVTFEAKVTQGNEAVNDADQVVFEIWRAKAKQHERIEIKHPKNGVYSLEKAFPEDGTYYIISHVTARNMHNMPKKVFIVGIPSGPEDSNAANLMDGMNMDGQSKKSNKNQPKHN